MSQETSTEDSAAEVLREIVAELEGPMAGYWTERMDDLVRRAHELPVD